MNTRRFGRTEFQISELVFGGGWVGGILIHQDPETRRKAFDAALDAGINWIDTAPSYGDGVSETHIGQLLRETPQASRPALSSKVRLDTESNESVASQIERSTADSLERLGVDAVDLHQLHNLIGPGTGGGIVSAADVLRPDGIADAFEALRDAGLTRSIGITAMGAIGPLKQVIASGRFDTAQVYYNMLNPSAAVDDIGDWRGHDFHGLIAACRAQDMGIMNIRVFAAGVIASEQRHGREVPTTDHADLDIETARAGAVFDALGDAHGTRAQSGLRFSLANPDLGCIVIGLAELAHLDQAVAAAAMGPLPAEAVDSVFDLFRRNYGL